jgi:hypothetical protein
MKKKKKKKKKEKEEYFSTYKKINIEYHIVV